MFDRRYSLAKPADIRELLAKNDQGINIMLALLYLNNDLQAKTGYLIKQEKRLVDETLKAEYVRLIGGMQEKRILLRGKLKELCKANGLIFSVQMSGRIDYIVKRKERNVNRPAGGLMHLTQKGLFVFGDLYSEEALLNMLMFGDDQ